jgi:hypothetical protein
MMARSRFSSVASSNVASSIVLACVLGALPGCVRETVSCADQPSAVCPDSGVPVDAARDAFSPFDAYVEPDAFVEGDAGPCSRCPSTMRACFENTCVECVNDGTCPMDRRRCDTEARVCRECLSPSDCSSPTPGCSREGVCVTCSLNTHCTSATGSRCDTTTNDCEPCVENGDCDHILGGPYCLTGVCVPCTPANEAMVCGDNACNPATGLCTTTRRSSVETCLPCVADSECMAGLTCAAVNPDRGVTGTYCLPRLSAPADLCARPFAEKVMAGTSASGASVSYCRHATTTCEAFRHYRTEGTGAMCTGSGATVDEACGAAGVADGVCRLSGVGNRCTYGCGGNDDCPCGGPGPTCPITCTAANVCSI